MPERLAITRLGADADGVAAGPDGAACYVPYSLPGEVVDCDVAGGRGALVSVHVESPQRVSPICRHFGACGGCALQHASEAFTADWKASLLADALARAGFADAPLSPIRTTPAAARRRADLAILRQGGRLAVGLHAPRSRAVIDLVECPVLAPSLAALIAPLRALLAGLAVPRREGSAIANLLDNGIDLLIRADTEPTVADRVVLVAFARAQGLARLSWARGPRPPEPIASFRAPEIALAGIVVAPVPGAFLQASRDGEAAITEAVLAGLPEKLPARAGVVELFAGAGTLTFALAQRARVDAYEGDAAAFAALRHAANRAGLSGRVRAQQRDLARQPLSVAELRGAACVVLDPPFAGAPAQMANLAAARPARIIHVGCNPAVLARDLRPLHAAGYRVLAATPIDQFRFSARLESVIVLASR